MIKKLRAYLLEDDNNRNSLSWYVVIIIIAPFIGVFFQYKKEKSLDVAKVNGCVLDKNIVRLKMYEQSLLLERFINVFGQENLGYLLETLFGGKDPQEFIIHNELLKVYLSCLFEKFFGEIGMVENFMLKAFGEKNNYLMRSLLGEFVFQLICSEENDRLAGFKKSIDMNKIDLYGLRVVAGDCIKKAFVLPLVSICSVVNDTVCGGGGLKEISFDVYRCSFSGRDDVAKIKKTIPKNSLVQFYNNRISDGHYRRDLFVDGLLSVYTMSREDGVVDDEFFSLVEKHYYSLLADTSTDLLGVSNLLERNFKSEYVDNKGRFVIKSNGEVYSSDFAVPKAVRDLFSRDVLSVIESKKMNGEGDKGYFVFISQGKIYFFKYNILPEVSFAGFEEIEERLMVDYLPKVLKEVTLKESNEIRYKYEESEEINLNKNWNKSYLVYDIKKYYEFLDQENKASVDKKKQGSKDGKYNKADADFYRLISSKLENKNIKKGMSFISCDEGECVIYCVKGKAEEKDDSCGHKKSFLDLQFLADAYIDCLFKEAKIEFINNDVSL